MLKNDLSELSNKYAFDLSDESEKDKEITDKAVAKKLTKEE